MKSNHIKKSLKMLVSKKSYLVLALIVAVISGLLLYYLSNVSSLIFMNSTAYVFISLSLTALISIIFGINIALVVYRFNTSKKLSVKENSTNMIGLFGGALASGCPACGLTLLGLLGISGGLSIFPFKGLELKILSMGLLMFSTYKISQYLQCKTCDTPGGSKWRKRK